MLYDKLKERVRQNMNIPRELFEKGQELVKAGIDAGGMIVTGIVIRKIRGNCPDDPERKLRYVT